MHCLSWSQEIETDHHKSTIRQAVKLNKIRACKMFTKYPPVGTALKMLAVIVFNNHLCLIFLPQGNKCSISLLQLFLLYRISYLNFSAYLFYHVQKSILNCTDSAKKACFFSKLQLLFVFPRHLGILFYIFVYISYLWKLLNIFYHFNLILPWSNWYSWP